MKAYLIGEDRLAGPRRTLDYIDTVLKKAALENCIQPRHAAGNPGREGVVLVRDHLVQSIVNGSVTVNVDPAPGLLATEILPRIASTSGLVIHKPTPNPPAVLLSATLWSCSKMRAWSASEMPIP